MLMSKKRLDVPGVWGPYYNAILPGYWTAEAGQSATGVLIDHVLKTHPAAAELSAETKKRFGVGYQYSFYGNCVLLLNNSQSYNSSGCLSTLKNSCIIFLKRTNFQIQRR